MFSFSPFSRFEKFQIKSKIQLLTVKQLRSESLEKRPILRTKRNIKLLISFFFLEMIACTSKIPHAEKEYLPLKITIKFTLNVTVFYYFYVIRLNFIILSTGTFVHIIRYVNCTQTIDQCKVSQFRVLFGKKGNKF